MSFIPDAERVDEMARVKTSRKRDLQEVIQAFVNKPLMPGEYVEADENLSLNEYNGKNVTVMSAIIIEMTKKALAGDKDTAGLLFKYGGYEPVKKQSIDISMPTFVNNVPDEIRDQIDAEAKELALLDLDEEEESSDDGDEEVDA